MNPSRNLSLGRIVTIVIAILLGLDTLSRFIPAKYFTFRSWEYITRFPCGPGFFTPNATYHNDRAFGDLGNMANLPETRVYRPENVSTDSYGFRANGPTSVQGPLRYFLIGDSFAGGCSLSDNETFSTKLEASLGQRIYNGAAMRIDVNHIAAQAQRLGMYAGTVLYLYFPRKDPLSIDFVRYVSPWGRWEKPLRFLNGAWVGFWKISPLEILAHRVLKCVQDGRLLPNPYAKNVFIGHLPDDLPILFFPEDVDNALRDRPRSVAGFIALRDGLATRHLKLSVILMPDKFTVYNEWIKERNPAAHGDRYLAELQQSLSQAAIPVLNLTQPFIREAGLRLKKGELLYWPDDTHWNSQGVDFAVSQVVNEFSHSHD